MNDALSDPPSPERLARQAYAAACSASGQLAHGGRTLPAWLKLEPETWAKLVDAFRRAIAEAPCLCLMCRARREPSPAP